MTSKKRIVIATIIGVVFYIFLSLSIISIIVFFPSIMDFFTMDNITVPDPRITYHEFPFHIEYMINGERAVIDNTLICEYGGFEKKTWLYKVNTGRSSLRLWNLKFKQYDDTVTPLDDIVLYCDDNIIIYYAFGSACYYMGDKDNPHRTVPSFRINDTINGEAKNNYNKDSYSIDQEKLLDYGIEIIDFVPPEPIENTFE